jgi:hypothetical protein
LGAKKAAFTNLRFTLFVVSEAWDLVKKDTLQSLRIVVRCSSSSSGGGEFRHKSREARKNFISKLQFNLIFFSLFFFFRASRFRICFYVSMYVSVYLNPAIC